MTRVSAAYAGSIWRTCNVGAGGNDDMEPKQKNDIRELALVVCAALSPMFFMAGRLDDMDEVLKSGVGVAIVAAVVTLYRVWSNRR